MQIYIEDENYDLNEIIAAAVKEATYFYEKYKINDFNLFIRLKEGKFEEVKMDGIVYKQAAGRIVVDRTGTIEYKNLLLNMSR